ncbi:MAG: deaminase [Patescibacteria group bacterium]|nr:deaminase [Patescibacteria group bacterium]
MPEILRQQPIVKNEKIEYPYLPEGKIIKYVSADNPFMAEAAHIRNTQSTDNQHPTGAVIVKDGVIIGQSANQAGFKHPKLIAIHAKGWCIRRILKVKSGTKYWLCPGCSTHADHGESGAVRDAINKAGAEKVKDADLYLYGHWWCCKPCWDAMIKAGIKNVYLLDNSWTLFNSRPNKNLNNK